jgi:D-glycero-D-manno-heptose 1,7-bisphosphate phosphatase
MRPAVFIDRDGTVIEEAGYLDRFDLIVPFPWSGRAIRMLKDVGYVVVIVTNQAGIARGFFDEPFVREVHARLDAMLRAEGVDVDGYYYCPHHPEGTVEGYRQACDCRKPAPGLVQAAARDLDLDPSRSFVIGDKWLDIELAKNVGATGVLVRTGYGRGVEATPPEGVRADIVVDTLREAAEWIVARGPAPRMDVPRAT